MLTQSHSGNQVPDVRGAGDLFTVVEEPGRLAAAPFAQAVEHGKWEIGRGAALSEPPVFALSPSIAVDFMSQVKPPVEKALASDQPQTAVDAFFHVIDPSFWDHAPDERKEIYRANLPAMLTDLQQPLYQLTTADLGKIYRPCLMMYGSTSIKWFIEIAKIVAGAIPNCRLVEIAGAGHATYAARPVEFAAAVRDFALSLPAVK